MKAIQFTVPVDGQEVFSLLEDRKDNFYSNYHRHDELQITCILKGKGTIMVGNVVQSFQEDDLFIIKPNDPHLFDKYRDGQGYTADIHAIHVFIHLERMRRLLVIPEFDRIEAYLLELDASKKLDSSTAKDMRQFFLNLLVKTSIPKFVEFVNLLHTLVQHQKDMVSMYSGIRDLVYSDENGERIGKICKFTFDHYRQHISVADVAALVNMTPTSFCKFFKKHTMKTYVEFLHEVRIEKACQLLINKKTERISETAFEVGFNSVVHFNRVFRQVAKVSPKEYLMQHGR